MVQYFPNYNFTQFNNNWGKQWFLQSIQIYKYYSKLLISLKVDTSSNILSLLFFLVSIPRLNVSLFALILTWQLMLESKIIFHVLYFIFYQQITTGFKKQLDTLVILVVVWSFVRTVKNKVALMKVSKQFETQTLKSLILPV